MYFVLIIIIVVITIITRIICYFKEILSLTGNMWVPENCEKCQRNGEDEAVLCRISSLSSRPFDIWNLRLRKTVK